MDVGGPAVVNGMLFINSGYGQWGGIARLCAACVFG